ncbi:hypothetical protein V501_07177 [Pseudogymnoascus sp. VKM F-4519 (FW-2642)]|nr:hypothetical protein V501_07177 [Pseudogymnoascus sp. VKM F-4519 (FW-2642)]
MAGSRSQDTTALPKRVVLASQRLPAWLRCAVWVSQYVYPGGNRMGGFGNVVRLPFGKVLKLNTNRNEINAMEYVRSHTSVPLPRVFTVYELPDGAIHILMEFVPGDRPGYTNMTPEQIKAFGQELAGYLRQLRNLEPPEEGFIGSWQTSTIIYDLEDLLKLLRLGGPLETWDKDPVVKKIHGGSESYKVKFTHANLNPRSIQYHNGKIQAIVDWEFAGWYPEYWEYTKMYFAEFPFYQPFFDAVVGEPGIEKYPEELRAERDIWRVVNPWRYDDYYGEPLTNGGRLQGGESLCNDEGTWAGAN